MSRLAGAQAVLSSGVVWLEFIWLGIFEFIQKFNNYVTAN